MNKYVVAYLSLFDGEIKQEIVEANSKVQAAVSYLDFEIDKFASMEEIESQLGDDYINVIQINNPRSGRSGSGLQNHLAEFDSPADFH